MLKIFHNAFYKYRFKNLKYVDDLNPRKIPGVAPQNQIEIF